MKGLQNLWIVGEKIEVDKIMIKYYDHASKFVQYIPKKPIKQVVKHLLFIATF